MLAACRASGAGKASTSAAEGGAVFECHSSTSKCLTATGSAYCIRHRSICVHMVCCSQPDRTACLPYEACNVPMLHLCCQSDHKESGPCSTLCACLPVLRHQLHLNCSKHQLALSYAIFDCAVYSRQYLHISLNAIFCNL